MFPGSAGEESTQVSKESTGSSAARSGPPCPVPAGRTPGPAEVAEPPLVLAAESCHLQKEKISLQSKALLHCKMPNENFKTTVKTRGRGLSSTAWLWQWVRSSPSDAQDSQATPWPHLPFGHGCRVGSVYRASSPCKAQFIGK